MRWARQELKLNDWWPELFGPWDHDLTPKQLMHILLDLQRDPRRNLLVEIYGKYRPNHDVKAKEARRRLIPPVSRRGEMMCKANRSDQSTDRTNIVDGSEIRRSPVEEKVVCPIIYTVFVHPRWCRISSINSMILIVIDNQSLLWTVVRWSWVDDNKVAFAPMVCWRLVNGKMRYSWHVFQAYLKMSLSIKTRWPRSVNMFWWCLHASIGIDSNEQYCSRNSND